jgi:sensor histidine kinase YesM
MERDDLIWTLLMKKQWLRHLAFWIAMALYFTWGYGFDQNHFLLSLCNALLLLPFMMLTTYITLYILLPKVLLKKNFLLFAVSFLLMIFLTSKLMSLFQEHITSKIPMFKLFSIAVGNNVLPLIKVVGIASSFKLIKYYYFREYEAEYEQQQQVKAELELLKSQIHPNFLFNTMNNLFAHTLRNSDESPQIVTKLSDLLRFMIYESGCTYIPIANEFDLLRNYAGLEKLRHGNDVDASITFSGDTDNKLIRPLLLLPLVENCFKYGTDERIEQKWVSINFHIDGNRLFANLANSKSEHNIAYDKNQNYKGLGLENVKKRLMLLYPDKSRLIIRDSEDIFQVSLEIEMDDAVALMDQDPNLKKELYDMEMLVG